MFCNKLLLIFVFSQCFFFEQEEILGVFVFGRHGHRYSYNHEVSDQQKGNLTSLGLRQHYQLGKYLRQKYPKFFEEMYSYPLNKAYASGQNRTFMSNQALMVGIYDFGSMKMQVDKELQKQSQPLWEQFKLPENLPETPLPEGQTPIPINSNIFDKNYYLEGWNRRTCSQLDKFNVSNMKQQQKFIEILNNKLIPQFEENGINVKEIIENKKIDFKVGSDLLDHVISQIYFGKYPKINQKLIQNIILLQGIQYHADYFNNDEMIKYQNTYPFNKLNNFLKSIKNQDQSKYQGSGINFMSVLFHDSNILAILKAFGYSEYDCLLEQINDDKEIQNCYGNPYYASSLIFELIKIKEEYFIKMIFNDKVLNIFENEEISQYDKFMKQLQKMYLPGNYEELFNYYCREPQQIQQSSIMMKILVLINLICICIMLYWIYQLVKKSDEQQIKQKIIYFQFSIYLLDLNLNLNKRNDQFIMKQFLKVSIALCLLSIVVSGYHYDDYLPEPVHVPQPQVQVDSGKVPTKYKWNGHHKMVKGHGHRHYDTYVKFSKHFDSNPKVMTAISGMDTSVNTCTRIVCEALNVTKHGFTMRLRTWWDTKVYSAICSWVAHSQC